MWKEEFPSFQYDGFQTETGAMILRKMKKPAD